MRRRATWLASILVLATTLCASAPARSAGRVPVRVLVPEEGNLQLLAFWVALGAGLFDAEGLDVTTVVPRAPALAQSAFTNGDAPVALLPAPVFERLIEERFSMVLVANLLENDPIDLVVPADVAAARGLRADLPLQDRLRALRGLRVGVGPHPRPRLAALFAAQGLDVDQVVHVVVVRGPDQNAALRERRVDALFTHTPHLENAVVDDGATVIVNLSAGEVPALSNRQIHALAVSRAFAASSPRSVEGLYRAIAKAEALVHRDPAAAVEAVLRALPARDRAHVATLVSLYAPAVPRSPEPSAARIRRELPFYPAGDPAPDLSKTDLAAYVRSAPSPARSASRWLAFAVGLLGLAISAAAVLGELLISRRNVDVDTSV